MQIRADIDSKKLQVRQLVGDSYHDLIDSADAIQSMAETAAAVAADLEHVRGVFSDLENTLSSSTAGVNAAAGGGMSRKQLELYGARITNLSACPLPFAA